MIASIIAVGSELLTPFRVDTNSLAITERLNTIGCDIRFKAVVGDNLDELARVLTAAMDTSDLVVCTGGLGPTGDDVTRDAAARVLGLPLDLDEAIVDRIRARFERRGLEMAEINRRQGMVPRGATVLENTRGTAPGLWLERGKTIVILLPGPPREMTPMLDAVIRDRLAPRAGGHGLFRRVLKITGRTESAVDAVAQPVYGPWATASIPITTTILAVMGQIELHLTAAAPGRAAGDPAGAAGTANGASVANAALSAAVDALVAVLGSAVYSVDGRPLEAVVGDLLRQAHWTIAAAESCTGGLLMSRLVSVPGASAYVDRGLVAYSNQAKVDWLGVPQALLEEHGAVSEPVARAMADGIRSRARTSVGVGITGIAGPDGGTPQKPVGTVAIAVVADADARVRTFEFIGDREQVNYQSTQAAMNMLRLMMSSGDVR